MEDFKTVKCLVVTAYLCIIFAYYAYSGYEKCRTEAETFEHLCFNR